jgi:small conductance mechanosensitive channel
MLIILFKPFRVGDLIEAQGIIATVNEIQIFVTKLTTANNQTVFVPNGVLSNGIIKLLYGQYRRADLYSPSPTTLILKTKTSSHPF